MQTFGTARPLGAPGAAATYGSASRVMSRFDVVNGRPRVSLILCFLELSGREDQTVWQNTTNT